MGNHCAEDYWRTRDRNHSNLATKSLYFNSPWLKWQGYFCSSLWRLSWNFVGRRYRRCLVSFYRLFWSIPDLHIYNACHFSFLAYFLRGKGPQTRSPRIRAHPYQVSQGASSYSYIGLQWAVRHRDLYTWAHTCSSPQASVPILSFNNRLLLLPVLRWRSSCSHKFSFHASRMGQEEDNLPCNGSNGISYFSDWPFDSFAPSKLACLYGNRNILHWVCERLLLCTVSSWCLHRSPIEISWWWSQSFRLSVLNEHVSPWCYHAMLSNPRKRPRWEFRILYHFRYRWIRTSGQFSDLPYFNSNRLEWRRSPEHTIWRRENSTHVGRSWLKFT